MKQTTKMWIGMTILAFASSAVTGAVIKNTKTNEAPAPIFAPSPAAAAAVSGGYVDLTSAAESAFCEPFSLYLQCAATPYSAISCISQVLI